MKLRATGRLRHHFFLEYSAGVGLLFETAADCALALPKLAPPGFGAPWQQSATNGRAATILVNAEQLKVLAAHLGTLGADVAAIDSVAHLIDYGDPFEIEVEVEDPRQLGLVLESGVQS